MSGWIGFLAVAAATLALAVLHAADIGFPIPAILADPVEVLSRTILAEGNVQLLAATLASLVVAMIGSTLALALWIVLRADGEERRFGERIALGGLAAVAVTIASAHLLGSPVFAAAGSLSSLLVTLGLSALAVLFDRLIELDEDEADDEGFRAALSLIGQEMARDAAQRAPRDPNR
ncbi:hypothetical protein [Aureimonas leprariae]|uniref:hypothetical protein n=1 Tax=Plantimonas leprariae TaxID=2615207 RepID=UPI001386BCAB|nr:hypothetical protein [Aureimonas leprariae]